MNIDAVTKWVEALLEVVDLTSVFIASLVEKFFPILPSYVLFPAIGMGASDSTDLALRCAVATVGSVGGAVGWYSLGAWIGEQRVGYLVGRYGKWIFLRPQLYDSMSASYRGYPFRITVLGQMVPTVRIFQALPAGVLRLPLGHFLVATAVGAQCWIAPLAGTGYLLRRQGWSAPEIGAGLFAALLAFEGAVLLTLLSRARRGVPDILNSTPGPDRRHGLEPGHSTSARPLARLH